MAIKKDKEILTLKIVRSQLSQDENKQTRAIVQQEKPCKPLSLTALALGNTPR